MSVSSLLLELKMEGNKIQLEGKVGEFTQFPQSPECRNVGELPIVRTKNGVE
jgi:hypothetical protein